MTGREYTLDELRIDLRGASARVDRNATKTLRKGARLVKKQMKIDAAGHQGNYFGIPGTEYTTPLPEHVSDELISPLVAEIGIEARGAGLLGGIIAYGSANNTPAYDPGAGPRRALPEVVQLFAETGEESVLGEEGKR